MHRRHPIEAPAADVRSRTFDSWARRAAQLFALVNVALAAPLLDLLASQPAFFVGHQLGRFDAILISLALSFGLPMLLLGLERLAGRRFGRHVHTTWIILLAAILGSQVARAQGSSAAIALAILFGMLAFGLLSRPKGRTFLTTLGLLCVVIPIQFCLSSGVASLDATPPLENAPEITHTQSVVFIVFDELPLVSLLRPDGTLNNTMFPAFAALAARATWYPNAITVAQATADAVPAMLTGRYPSGQHSSDPARQPTLADHPRNLFTLLGRSMPVDAIETASALCPLSICPPKAGLERVLAPPLWLDLTIVLGHVVLPRFLTSRLPAIDHAWAGFAEMRKKRGHSSTSQARQVENALALIDRRNEGANRGEPPSFSFLHLQLPHTPWQFLPSGSTYARLTKLGFMNGKNTIDDPWIARQAQQRHLLQLGYVDRLLGAFHDQLRQSSAYDRTLLVVTSDHGRAFLPNVSARGVGSRNAHAILPIPLFVKYPGQVEGRVDDRFAETVDIVPTILDSLGVARGQWQADGTSLRDGPGPHRQTTAVYRRPTPNRPQAQVYRADRRAVATQRLEPARRLRRDFGQRIEDLYRLVPAPRLRPYLDRPLAELPFVDGRLATTLSEPGEQIHVDPADRKLPVYVAGTVEAGHADHRVHVAIAVDGIVRAFTRTVSRARGRPQPFQAILPPSCMPPGEHRVEAVGLRSLQ